MEPKSLPLKVGLGTVRMYGGPYREKPQSMYGVCMAAELCSLPHDVAVPTRDFSVPNVEELHHGLRMALRAALADREVYVGCMGGYGRTGLFLAAMAKFLGHKDPVGYVRKHYDSHAVETREQEEFISALKFKGMFGMKVSAWVLGLFHIEEKG